MSVELTTLSKRATGIVDLDTVTHGGLPGRGATLVMGDAGAGKTVLGLQILANAVAAGDGAVCVSFEESRDGVARGAASFDWGADLMASERMIVIDARPPPGAAVAGGFDIEGLIAMVEAKAQAVDAHWVVVDGIDRLLNLQPDARQALFEVDRLRRWCEDAGLSLLFTGKTNGQQAVSGYLEGIEYLLDAVLVVSVRLTDNRLNRRFRIAKYRGTAHETRELAMVMDQRGIHLGYDTVALDDPAPVSSRRLSTGIPRLDDVLDGGIYAGSTILISGLPGTSKTTLAAQFALAAAERGERVLYLSFDELADRIVRNVGSVGIDLGRYRDSGQLTIKARQAWRATVEEHYIEVIDDLEEMAPDFLVIDPISALLKATSEENAMEINERLLQMANARGITCVATSLSETDASEGEATLSQASTLADAWIALSYHVQGGERNRTLSVVKARGSAPSNQVREVLLSDRGLELADVYQFGTEVLMGTARLQKEMETRRAAEAEQAQRQQRRWELASHIEQAESRIREANSEIQRLQEQLAQEDEAYAEADRKTTTRHDEIQAKRTPQASERGGHSADDDGSNEQ